MTSARGAGARRPELLATSLGALIASTGSRPTVAPAGIGVGAAAMVDDTAWVIIDGSALTGVGASLAWALRREAERLILVADGDAEIAARRVAGFGYDVSVRRAADGRLVEVSAAAHLPDVEASAEHLVFVDTIATAGATPVIEHGVVTGEVLGLEVCRVIDDPVVGAARLEVGVGAHDRETFQMVHGERPTVDALRDVVDFVTTHRTPGGEPHPLGRLAVSRLLRSRVVADPGVLGGALPSGTPLVALDPPVARTNVKDDTPCAAATTGCDTVLVFSSGVDLEAVPFAADTADRVGAARAVVVVERRNAVDIQHRLAERVRVPTAVVAVDG